MNCTEDSFLSRSRQFDENQILTLNCWRTGFPVLKTVYDLDLRPLRRRQVLDTEILDLKKNWTKKQGITWWDTRRDPNGNFVAKKRNFFSNFSAFLNWPTSRGSTKSYREMTTSGNHQNITGKTAQSGSFKDFTGNLFQSVSWIFISSNCFIGRDIISLFKSTKQFCKWKISSRAERVFHRGKKLVGVNCCDFFY